LLQAFRHLLRTRVGRGVGRSRIGIDGFGGQRGREGDKLDLALGVGQRRDEAKPQQ
jgi:hypothetical protein